MKIILLQDVPKIGYKYDVKNVASGYARNFLIPRGMAQIATPNSIINTASQKKIHQEEKEEKIKKIYSIIGKINGSEGVINAKANEKGSLFAGIGKNDIQKILGDNGFEAIGSDNIILLEPIKATGTHTIKLDAGVGEKGEFVLNVKKEE